jgi:hypothetical protein
LLFLMRWDHPCSSDVDSVVSDANGPAVRITELRTPFAKAQTLK